MPSKLGALMRAVLCACLAVPSPLWAGVQPGPLRGDGTRGGGRVLQLRGGGNCLSVPRECYERAMSLQLSAKRKQRAESLGHGTERRSRSSSAARCDGWWGDCREEAHQDSSSSALQVEVVNEDSSSEGSSAGPPPLDDATRPELARTGGCDDYRPQRQRSRYVLGELLRPPSPEHDAPAGKECTGGGASPARVESAPCASDRAAESSAFAYPAKAHKRLVVDLARGVVVGAAHGNGGVRGSGRGAGTSRGAQGPLCGSAQAVRPIGRNYNTTTNNDSNDYESARELGFRAANSLDEGEGGKGGGGGWGQRQMERVECREGDREGDRDGQGDREGEGGQEAAEERAGGSAVESQEVGCQKRRCVCCVCVGRACAR